MKTTKELFENNRHWAKRMTQINRRFFKDLARQQTPKYLWILYLHGWVYDIHDGLLKDLKVSINKDKRPASRLVLLGAPR